MRMKHQKKLFDWDKKSSMADQFKKETSHKSIIDQFKKEARDIWDNPPDRDIFNYYGTQVDVKFHKRKRPFMSLSYFDDKRPRAVGSQILRPREKYTLNISSEAQKISEDQFRQGLRHEALHLGYSRHDNIYLRDLARRHKIPMTVGDIHHGKRVYRVQGKIGSRFKDIKHFTDRSQAIAYMYSLQRGKYSKFRTIW